MKYYKLLYDYENDEQYINCDESCIGNLDEYCVKKGIPQERWGNVTFTYDSREGSILSDYAANSLTWLLVSEKCYHLIREKISDNCIQFLPVRLIDRAEKQRPTGYYALNILDIVENAVNMEKSKYTLFGSGDCKLVSFQKYVLRTESINGLHIFKLKEAPFSVFVSELIRESIVQNGMTGFDFLEISVT